ncbi:NAD-dependent epimerase/dehydratase family protein [Azospirillum agricola]|uniref:NAD-dependent epimerase/dehydratase family protein n=1 Tax=Azospirillum agricola TaxID=1720247 RepID=UPI000A0EFBB8|nr:NAD-dependent epimerase/dehydratase family protein [Azospirillum agricola]SMH41301.1 Nucleoside-diphosphate-sugar epimerase [Azospirillum lipoferum]
MHIAILGATSQLASDLILGWAGNSTILLDLFARRPDAVATWAKGKGLAGRFRAAPFDQFGTGDTKYDAIINFVGVGDPARAAEMGASILDITHHYDSIALEYQNRYPQCRYLFLSSGAVYGSTFLEPAGRSTRSQIAINDLPAQEYYAVSKLYAESRHRARPGRPIIDIRVFNYFSRTQDLDARFFITDIVRAIRSGNVLKASDDVMVRDFLHPSDLRGLVEALLAAPPVNVPVDCYTRSPVNKSTLLQAMAGWFGLRWEITAGPTSPLINATGTKPHYYSTNTRAAEFGYQPKYSSLNGLKEEIEAILN